MLDKQKICIDCHVKPAAPKRKICWNCKLKRHLKTHPENVAKTNGRRRQRYKNDTNGCRTRMLSYLEEWRKDHREESVETARLWRENNPERHSFNNLRWRLNNLERFTHGRIHWRSLNPEKVRLSSRLRKARLRQASIGTLTVELWQERLEEFNFRCAYCLQPLERVTMDHMTPVTQGGLHDITNVVPACGSCNSRKNAKNLLEWLLYLEGIRSCAATQGMGERLAEAIRLAL